MAFTQARAGNFHKISFRFHRLNIRSTAISHTSTKTAHQLINCIGQRSFVGYTAFHTFRHKFFCIFLEVSIPAPMFHSSDGSHSPVYLKLASLVNFRSSGTFLASCKQRADHDHIGAGGNSLGQVSGIFDTTICNNWNTRLAGNRISVHNRSQLRHADTSYHSCSTDRSRTNTYLDCVRTSRDQISGSVCSGNITRNYLRIRKCIFEFSHTLNNISGMSMCAV